MNSTVVIKKETLHTFHINNVRSVDEAEDIALERLEDGDADETETTDTFIYDSFETEDDET